LVATLSKSTSNLPFAQASPFRRAVIRGLGILLPPLLTIVIFVWVGNTVAEYLLVPLESAARSIIYRSTADILPTSAEEEGTRDPENPSILILDDAIYRRTPDEKYVPLSVYEAVRQRLDNDPMPETAKAIYVRFIDEEYLQRTFVVPVFLLFFILILYLLGKFLAAGVGKFFWSQFERIIHQLPVVRNVYSSVKQVTDFLFSEREVEFRRVVAVEYPRKGMWSLGMVTGEGLLDIRGAANEPVLSILIPTSPMPFTGFTATVKKSETVDLNLSIDQACQYIMSCGVVLPPHQVSALADAPEPSVVDGVERPRSAFAQPVGREL
jgi:uncharacterized membrane protein